MEKENTSLAAEESQKETWYAYCRIPGGFQFKVRSGNDDEKTIVIKSGTAADLAPDGTLTYKINPQVFGVTQLTRQEKEQILEQVKSTKFYQNKFLFFASSKENGDRIAADHLRKFPETGMEPLDSRAMAGNATVFNQD